MYVYFFRYWPSSVRKEITELMSYEVFVHALISDQINISGDGLSFSGYTGCIIQLLTDSWLYVLTDFLSSPRAGPKGLRAESARAFTGRRNSHSGRGEDFLSRQSIFFTETAVTPERKVEKSFPRWEINRHAEG